MSDKNGNHELEQVWRTIAHDLAAPLLVLQGNLKNLTTEFIPLLHDMYQKAKAAGLDLSAIEPNQLESYEEMLSDSKLTADWLRQLISRWNYKLLPNGFKPSHQPLSIKACIETGINNYQSVYELMDKSRVQIELDDATVLGDEKMIHHVLYELLDNAEYAATSNGNDEHNAIVVMSSVIDNDNYHLHVKNIGVTVDDANLSKLFEPYFTTKSSNIGLGLTFCQRAMKAMDGNISYHPQSDGVEFTLTFPLDKH